MIPISSRHLTEGMRRAIKAAKGGEVVCIFPEGHISRTCQLTEIKEGFATIARRAGVPVLPAAIDGLGARSSPFSATKYLWKNAAPARPTEVTVARPGDPA